MTIALDPELSAVANADAYYTRARKARRAGEGLAERRAAAQSALDYLAELAYDLDQAPDRGAIDAVAAAVAELGLHSPAGRGSAAARARAGGRGGGGRADVPGAGGPLRVVSGDGFTIWVGRNSRQNDALTFTRGARGDIWLHARGVPGAHVLVKAAGRPIPESTIVEAAALAAWFSRFRGEGAAEVMVTDVRHVRRHPSGRPGLVTVEGDRTVVVRPAPPE
jgi:predicted ribosome quality control (RQC) complex YloA/Tae2 family protein